MPLPNTPINALSSRLSFHYSMGAQVNTLMHFTTKHHNRFPLQRSSSITARHRLSGSNQHSTPQEPPPDLTLLTVKGDYPRLLIQLELEATALDPPGLNINSSSFQPSTPLTQTSATKELGCLEPESRHFHHIFVRSFLPPGASFQTPPPIPLDIIETSNYQEHSGHQRPVQTEPAYPHSLPSGKAAFWY